MKVPVVARRKRSSETEAHNLLGSMLGRKIAYEDARGINRISYVIISILEHPHCIHTPYTVYSRCAVGEPVSSIPSTYNYLERRLTGNCAAPYDCRASYLVCELAQLFDPSFVAENAADINEAWVRRLSEIAPLASYGQGDGVDDGTDGAGDEELPFVSRLCRGLTLFLAAAKGFTCNHGDVGEFTEDVLRWWKNHGNEVGVWAVGARIIFALSPNSAAAERNFSQMKDMFQTNQTTALAGIL